MLRLLVLAVLAGAAFEADAREYRVEVAGRDGKPLALYAEDVGEGPPLLLLHGLGESTFTWRHVVPGLARDHRVIALDLKGFGRSDKPLDDSYSAEDQALLVAAFIEKRRLWGVTLIGHSFGGTVALRTALLPPMRARGRIARLIAISAPALPRSAASHLDLVSIPALPDALTASLPPEVLARLILREARGGTEPPEEDVQGYAAPYYDLAAKHAFLVTARSIVSERNGDIARRYRAIRQPTLLVWCRDDPIVPLKAGRRLKRALPNARLVTLPGCHHLPQDERPQALAAAIAGFLGR